MVIIVNNKDAAKRMIWENIIFWRRFSFQQCWYSINTGGWWLLYCRNTCCEVRSLSIGYEGSY